MVFPSKDSAIQKITELVERFDDQREFYKKSEYNETLTRKDYIDPFFEALGWDMNNKLGAWEAYREVIHEDKLKIAGQTKAPDYSFRLHGGQRLFFVEAKKPSVVVKDDIAPAYQVRLYGWNAKLPLSVVTDFEEFAIYDCTKKPLRTDKASKARLNYFTYKDYLSNFDFFWNTFSREQVIKGGLIKFQKIEKKGTATVDKEFLENLDEWRKLLAANIFKNNSGISEEYLNYTVQQNIDRIIFLRIAEDRALEPFGQLKSCLQYNDNPGGYYKELYRQYRVADNKYNSGLFHFRKEKENNEAPDIISGQLQVDNRIIKSIVSSLYPPNSDYLFNVLPVEILGSAYEQFLGKQIIIKGNRIDIEEKPEVRKAGGVYYTPQYIVDYIVQQTVGKLCEGKSVNEIAKLKIVDPACGSGSFLLGAYQFLLNKHLELYKNIPVGSKRQAVLTPEGSLTTAEKKRILLNNIYGVDIDRNAVEVTKLSLLLKCMEGETQASINTQMTFFHERALPSLEKNIKSGNSLIDLDFYDDEFDFTPDAEKKIKPFSWRQAFPQVFENGGFNVVIGNPPWGADFSPSCANYIRGKFICANTGTFDSYALFVEKAIRILKQNGLLGFIIPDTFLRKGDFYSFRDFLFERYTIKELIETGPLFSKVRDTWCCVVNIEKKSPSDSTLITHKKLSRFIVSVEDRLQKFGNKDWDANTTIIQRVWRSKYQKVVGYKATDEEQKIIEKIETNPRLKSLSQYKISRGEEGSKLNIAESPKGDYLMIIPEDIEKHYVSNGKRIFSNSLTQGKVQAIYSHPKIWIIRIQKMRWFQRIVSAVDERLNTAGMKTLQSITSTEDNLGDLLFLQSILTSRLINFWCVNYLTDDINQSYLEKIPIKTATKEEKQQLISAVQNIMHLHKEKHQTASPEKLEQLQQRINYTDDKINQLVYQLYSLNQDEIAIVEAG